MGFGTQNRNPCADASALSVEGQVAAKFLFADFRPDLATRRGLGMVRGQPWPTYGRFKLFIPLVC